MRFGLCSGKLRVKTVDESGTAAKQEHDVKLRVNKCSSLSQLKPKTERERAGMKWRNHATVLTRLEI